MRKYWKMLFSVVMILTMLAFNQTVLAKDSTVQTSISVENVLERAGDSTPFSIALESIDAMKTIEEITIAGSGKASFSPLTFTTVGQYTYRVYQKPSQTKDYQADTTVFDVLVYVTYDEDGTLVAKVISRRAGDEEKSAITFKPKRLVKPIPPRQPDIPKTPLPVAGEVKSLLGILSIVLLGLLVLLYVKKLKNRL
ncbi:Spy0128 family protein [Streptococcus pyogenes]|uniref:Spy0128 family protein n=1 Tax=Streptococcus pyogenes TaxID=1314 RepID=UPI0010DB75E9|nr:FctA domain-containing protein [Streptococcus pyogenes]VGQ27232.1 surface-anchored protein [Streptococcus pyogenes]VHC14312.1 surface-anchored protein [Streptococcus pyogenes]VHD01402.1 surface-anchored protein [Streptococcus pyogenes]